CQLAATHAMSGRYGRDRRSHMGRRLLRRRTGGKRGHDGCGCKARPDDELAQRGYWHASTGRRGMWPHAGMLQPAVHVPLAGEAEVPGAMPGPDWRRRSVRDSVRAERSLRWQAKSKRQAVITLRLRPCGPTLRVNGGT